MTGQLVRNPQTAFPDEDHPFGASDPLLEPALGSNTGSLVTIPAVSLGASTAADVPVKSSFSAQPSGLVERAG